MEVPQPGSLRFIFLVPWPSDDIDDDMNIALWCAKCEEYIQIPPPLTAYKHLGTTPSDAVAAQFDHMSAKHAKDRRNASLGENYY